MDEKRKFGELELSIMNLLWEKKRVTVTDVQSALGRDSAYTTIMTVLSRMYNKGLVDREKSGKNYVYFTKSDKPREVGNMLDNIKKSIFGGNSFQLVNYLIDNSSDIKKEDLDQISKMIEKRKKEMGN